MHKATIYFLMAIWWAALISALAFDCKNHICTPSQLQPAEFFYLQRNYPEISFPLKAYTKAIEDAWEKRMEKSLPGFDRPWITRGPGNIGARINTIAIHPDNPNIVYVGFAVGGIFKTTDGGAHWFPVFDDQPFLAIGDLVIDPQNPETIYAGTGDPSISAYPFIGDGLYKSTNGGVSWQKLGLTDQRIISRIAVDPSNPNIIYAACMGLPFERNNDRGLYKSIDGGQNWSQVLFVSNQAGIIDLVMDPTHPQTLYAASWDRIRNNMESTVNGPNAKIFKTTDGGNNWQQLTNGLPVDNQGRIGLAMYPGNSNVLYALYVGLNSQVYNVYFTNNGGISWTPTMSQGEVPMLLPSALGGFGWYFGQIRVAPNNPNDVFILGVDLWRSQDGGANWNIAAPPWGTYEVHADKHDLKFVPNGTMLLATDGGLYKTTDNTQTWLDIDNIPANQFYRVAVNLNRPDWYYGGVQDNGSTGGPDLATDWERIYGADGFQMAFRPDAPEVVFAESQNGGIAVSTDFGNSWSGGDTGIPNNDRRHWDMQYIISTHNPDIMYTGTQRVYKNISGANPFWTAISDDLTDGVIFSPSFHTISTVAESPVVQGLLYAGTTDGNLWRSDGDGDTWISIADGLPDRYVTNVEPSPTYADLVYVSFSGYKSNDFTPRIYRSFNRGQSWESISGNLPSLAVNDILVLPEQGDSIIFAATDGGVYGTLNGGEQWERLGANMPMIPVFHLAWNPITDELVAGTHGRSIMSYPLDSLGITPDTVVTQVPVIKDNFQFRLYPNPATTFLQIENEARGLLSFEVMVLNTKGEVLTKQSSKQGEKTLQLSVNNWLPGAYFAIIEANGTKIIRKFVILRL